MLILAIETSCDETAISLLEASGGLRQPRFKILKHLVASQIEIHRPFGGVVPNLAKREHIKNLPILYRKIFENPKSQALNLKTRSRTNSLHGRRTINPKFEIQKIDLIAVTVGPGLEPALWTGIEFAKDLAVKNKKSLIGINHLEGHLYSFLLPQKTKKYNLNIKTLFPAASLIISGGHTILLLMKDLETIEKLGETRDDAVGEAFDKVARLLKLSYPGGPEVEKMAKYGNSQAINFPRPMIEQKNYDFSFSGLKTAVLYYLRNNRKATVADVAASFQSAAFDVLIKKTLRAALEYKSKTVMVSGGVVANKELRRQFQAAVSGQEIKVFFPDFRFCTDNATIIGAAGHINFLRGRKLKLVADGSLNFRR